MNHAEAVQCLRALHETIAPMVIGLAQDRPLRKSDLMAIRRLPSVSRDLLDYLSITEPKILKPTAPTPEGQVSRCLAALLVRTSELLGDCARMPLPQALDNAIAVCSVHGLTWGVVHALGLEGT